MAYSDIKDPSAHFNTLLWTGNGADNRALTNDANAGNFKPDWVWVKGRSQAEWHNAYDSSRGANKGIYTNSTYQEESLSETFESFDTNGFTVSYNSAYSSVFTNKNSTTYVGWQWKANGGTTTSVSASGTGSGCVNACTYQANTTAGFSIITYTGRDDQLSNGQESKLTHGLGVAPDATIMKRRDSTGDWYVMGAFGGANGYPYSNNQFAKLNGTESINGNYYVGDTAPDATHIFLGNALVNIASATYVCYAFAEKQGYSKFGKYVGNGSTDGPFIYTGFKPAVVINKRTDTGGPWTIFDSARCPNNVNNAKLYPHLNNAEVTTTGDPIDFLSNGYKLRGSGADCNVSGATYIFMAFAENPFVAGGVPTTAR